MSTPAESLATVGMSTQEAATSALRSWADGLQMFSGGESVLSEMPAMISRYFDAVQQVLDSQRQFAETMATAVQTAQTFTNQAARAAEETMNALHIAADGAATRHQSDQRANQRDGALRQGCHRLTLHFRTLS